MQNKKNCRANNNGGKWNFGGEKSKFKSYKDVPATGMIKKEEARLR